jgi:dTMP kinase
MDGEGVADPGRTVLQGGSPAAYRELARNRPLRNLMLATFTSAMGDWIGFLAIIALTVDIMGPTGAATFAVSGVMVARVLPSLLLGPVAGVFVDRWDRKRVLIWTDIGRGTVMAMIPFTDEVFTLVLATLLIEAMSSLFSPAKDAVLPTLVRPNQLVATNQVNLLSTYGTLPIGAALYAVMVEATVGLAPAGSFLAERPIAVPIWFNALSFWISAPLLARLTFPRGTARRAFDPATTPGAWEQMKEGFRFIGGYPVVRALVLGIMVAFGAAGGVIVGGEFFGRLLNAGPGAYGILVSVVGAGLVIGLLASSALTRRVEPERLFAPGISVAGACLMATAAMPSLRTAIAPALVMGIGAGIAFIVGYTVLQARADDRIRGRTFGALNSGIRVAIFASVTAVPLVIGFIGREVPERVVLEGAVIGTMYPYTFGGVRIALMGAGALALIGGVLTGRSLHRGMQAEEPAAMGLEPAVPDTLTPTLHGMLIAFEGGDGTGKSTQIRLLRSAIERAGHDVVVTREPGGTGIGEQLRGVVLAPSSDAMGDRTEALLYAAARAQHVHELIQPALEKGAVVLVDRFIDSSVVYQGAGRGLGEDQIAELNRWATGGLVPDLVVLLDLAPEEGLERAGTAGEPDRLETAGIGFHRVVRAAYRRRAETDPHRYLLLDARRSVEDLHAEIRETVLGRLAELEEGT